MRPLERNYEAFLKLDTSPYQDKWVAIVDGKVVAANKSFKGAYEEAKKLNPKCRPFLSKVPGAKAMIL